MIFVNIVYFIRTVDERCDMELDETDPAVWLKLEAATEEYIQNNSQALKNVCERLQPDEKSENLKAQYIHMTKASNTGISSCSCHRLFSFLFLIYLKSDLF